MIYDISMEINEKMMVYKNKESKRPKRENILTYSEHGINESKMLMDLHTGTHVDAPFHMLGDGKTIETLDVGRLLTKVKVLDLTDADDRITDAELREKEIPEKSFILLKTRNSLTEEYEAGFVFLAESGAEYLRNKGIKGVGIDSLGIERSQPGHETHKILLGSDAIIIEGLRLREIEEGEYMMYALPLKITGGDGAPARVVLEEL